jgi:prepilin-type N-terminal cleavage/methylation domain-containing protein
MARPEQGSTLIELLISIVIMGIAVTALLGGLLEGSLTSGINRQKTDVANVLASVQASLQDQAWHRCADPAYDVSDVPLPRGWTPAAVQITSIGFWNGDAFQATCTDPGRSPDLFALQLVTVTVTSPVGGNSRSRASQTRSFVKAPQ